MSVRQDQTLLTFAFIGFRLCGGPVFGEGGVGCYGPEVNLRMDPDEEENRWILAGAALVMTDD